jgi:NAD+ kinase
MRVGLKYFDKFPQAVETARTVSEIFAKYGVEIVQLPYELRSDVPEVPHENMLDLLKELDLLLSVGGDGTFLSSSRLACYADVPVLGINAGRFGFLTEIRCEELNGVMDRILAGDYHIEERRMMTASFQHEERTLEYIALNDLVIHRQALSRIISLDTYLNEQHIATYEGDGLIISTPTGSTAYNLSAGGSIVHPGVDCLLLTPICPHTLNVRPMIIPPDSQLKVVARFSGIPSDINLTFDGQRSANIMEEKPVDIDYSDLRCRMVRLRDEDFFSLIKRKLHWAADIR